MTRKKRGYGGNIRGPLMGETKFYGSVLHQETEMNYNEYLRERERTLRRDRPLSPFDMRPPGWLL